VLPHAYSLGEGSISWVTIQFTVCNHQWEERL
jgi:hypothetical protein